MQKKNIDELIQGFFGKEHPEEVQEKFRSWFMRTENSEEKEQAMQNVWDTLPVTPGLSSLDELEKLNKHIQRRNIRRIAAIAAAIILPLFIGMGTLLFFDNPNEEVKLVEYFVPNGQRNNIVLPDGSVVWLNSGSVLIYPEEFRGTNRTVYLSGEGYFTVEHHEDKPFIVKASHVNIEVLGTVFNMNSYPDLPYTTTTLQSGRVKVSGKSGKMETVILEPNEQLIYNHAMTAFTKSTVDAERVSTWIEGNLVFDNEPLSIIFRVLERKFNLKINYASDKLVNQKFNVRFREEETLEDVLNILNRLGANFKYQMNETDVFIN